MAVAFVETFVGPRRTSFVQLKWDWLDTRETKHSVQMKPVNHGQVATTVGLPTSRGERLQPRIFPMIKRKNLRGRPIPRPPPLFNSTSFASVSPSSPRVSRWEASSTSFSQTRSGHGWLRFPHRTLADGAFDSGFFLPLQRSPLRSWLNFRANTQGSVWNFRKVDFLGFLF